MFHRLQDKLSVIKALWSSGVPTAAPRSKTATTIISPRPRARSCYCLCMIDFQPTAGNKPRAVQRTSVPLVYLGQWAYMALAKDQRQLARFAEELLRSRGGTLAFSVINHYEIARINDLSSDKGSSARYAAA